MSVPTGTFGAEKAQRSLRQHFPGASRHPSGSSCARNSNKGTRSKVCERREAARWVPSRGWCQPLPCPPVTPCHSLSFPGCHSQQCQEAAPTQNPTSLIYSSSLSDLGPLHASHPLAGQCGARSSPGCAAFKLFPRLAARVWGVFIFAALRNTSATSPWGCCRGRRGALLLQHLPRRAGLCSCRGCSQVSKGKKRFLLLSEKARLWLAALIMHI